MKLSPLMVGLVDVVVSAVRVKPAPMAPSAMWRFRPVDGPATVRRRRAAQALKVSVVARM